ncbi:MAG: hypothetical protein U5K55_01795 [Aliarcobacter sp.]|nr:hypothetical protein [Aliarcobacter sp.]
MKKIIFRKEDRQQKREKGKKRGKATFLNKVFSYLKLPVPLFHFQEEFLAVKLP